jgi:hypothetical protein
VRLFGTGWAWKQPDYLVVLAADPETVFEALAWAGDVPVQVTDGDVVLRNAVSEAGYVELTWCSGHSGGASLADWSLL